MNEMLVFGDPGYIPPEHDFRLKVNTASNTTGHNGNLIEYGFVDLQPYSSYPEEHATNYINYLFSGVTDDNILLSARLKNLHYYERDDNVFFVKFDYSAYTGNDVLVQDSACEWHSAWWPATFVGTIDLTFDIEGPNQSTPATINGVAMSYHIDQQGIVPDSAYYTVDKYNPLNLPPYTMRLKYIDGSNQLVRFDSGRSSCIFTQISESPNIWDITRTAADDPGGDISSWDYLFADHYDLLEVIGANAEGVTSMYETFTNCPRLSSVCLFNTENVVDARYMFSNEVHGFGSEIIHRSGCSALSSLPEFNFNSLVSMGRLCRGCSKLSSIKLNSLQNVDSITEAFKDCSSLQSADLGSLDIMRYANYAFEDCSSLEYINLGELNNISSMNYMFENCTSLTALPTINSNHVKTVGSAFANCYNVTGGILDMYNQFTGQSVAPTRYTGCFKDCGINTVQGAAELAQIPSDWK